MAIRLDTRSADFAQKFRAFLDGKRETSADVEAAVRSIVADVVARSRSTRRNSTGSISTASGSGCHRTKSPPRSALARRPRSTR
jgi:hypothetical protein